MCVYIAVIYISWLNVLHVDGYYVVSWTGLVWDHTFLITTVINGDNCSWWCSLQRMTTSSSSPSLLNDGAKNFSHNTHGKPPTVLCEAAVSTHPLNIVSTAAQVLTLHGLSQIQWILRHPHSSVILVLSAFLKGERWAHTHLLQETRSLVSDSSGRLHGILASFFLVLPGS